MNDGGDLARGRIARFVRQRERAEDARGKVSANGNRDAPLPRRATFHELPEREIWHVFQHEGRPPLVIEQEVDELEDVRAGHASERTCFDRQCADPRHVVGPIHALASRQGEGACEAGNRPA
jgi:hypothetical protein